ncbi:MAG: hypothetical protein RIT13_1829, partial [Pseudomonadota bacterium]
MIFLKIVKRGKNLVFCTKITVNHFLKFFTVLNPQFSASAMPNRFFFFSNLSANSSDSSKWRSICFTALLALWFVFNACTSAQAFVRPEVDKSLQAAQEAMRTGQFENAISLAQQALSMPGITPDERPVIQRTLAVAAIQGKNFTLAISTLEALLQELPEGTPSAQKLPLIESLLGASQQAQDLARLA